MSLESLGGRTVFLGEPTVDNRQSRAAGRQAGAHATILEQALQAQSVVGSFTEKLVLGEPRAHRLSRVAVKVDLAWLLGDGGLVSRKQKADRHENKSAGSRVRSRSG